MKRLLFIYNPHAGKELLKPKLADVIDIFVKAGYEVVAYPTQAYRDAYKKIKKYDSGSRSDIFRPVQQMTSQAAFIFREDYWRRQTMQ